MNKNRKPVYIIGIRTSFLVEAIEIIEENGFRDIVLVDNQKEPVESTIEGYPVKNLLSLLGDKKAKDYFICIHTPMYREQISKSLAKTSFRPKTFIHPKIILSKRAVVSVDGVLIAGGAVIGSHTNIDKFVLINRGALIGHHVTVEEYVTIESGAIIGAMVLIGKGSYIGMGAKILPKVTIGNHSIIAAGAVVKEDVPDNTMVAGVPAVVKKTGIRGYIGS